MATPTPANSSTAPAEPTPTNPVSATNEHELATDSTEPAQTALQIWEAFDLNGRRAAMDQQGLEIADRQEASASARKQLSVSTRTFKKSMSEGQAISAKSVGALLREYQTEVDALTNRAKSAESAFLTLYKALYDAPDPVEELSRAASDAQTISTLKSELRVLREERGGLVERNAAASKYEMRIADLERQLSEADARMAEEARLHVEEKQAQWMATQQKTLEAYELREQELLHQIRLANESARKQQATSDAIERQLNETRSQLEDVKNNRASVDEMTVEDLERTRAEVKILRTRCNELENQNAGESGEGDSAGTTSTVGRSALSAELAAREVEVSQLKDQVTALEEVLSGKDQEKSNQFAGLTASIVEKDEQLTVLRETLSKLPSLDEYEEMKRQYETLQAFQLLENERDSGDTVDNTDNIDSSSGGAGKSSETLEKRLLGKVKSLEGRLTRMRVELGERDTRINELLGIVRTFEEQVTDQKSLIANLEDSINAITGDQSSVHILKRRAAAASRIDLDSTSGTVDDKETESTTAGESTWDWGEKHQAAGLQEIIREEPSMLDIVAGQRDRFRSRAMELEEDNRKLMERIEKLTTDLDSLKSDNVQLYEKIRFLQSYKQSQGELGSAGPSSNDLMHRAGDEEEGGGGFLGKYKSMYEDMVNPYTIFNRRERHKRMSEMSAPERLTLRASQRALSTKTSRLIVFFYIISLHIFVALVLGFSASTGCDSEVTTKAQH